MGDLDEETDGEFDYCEYAGHEWQPAGGGLLICAACEECGESLVDSYGPDWCQTHLDHPCA